jgi:hypothetical protein
MRLNLAVLALTGATMLTGVGCDVGDIPAEEQSADVVTVTEMTLLPDGNWRTTSERTIPRQQNLRSDVNPQNGVEVRQNPLYVVPCSGAFDIVLNSAEWFNGNYLCLNTGGTNQTVNFGWIWPARSVLTYKPVFLYDANNSLVFFNCHATVKSNGAMWPPATVAKEANPRAAVCSF